MDDTVSRICAYWVWQARSRRLDEWRYFPSVYPWRTHRLQELETLVDNLLPEHLNAWHVMDVEYSTQLG